MTHGLFTAPSLWKKKNLSLKILLKWEPKKMRCFRNLITAASRKDSFKLSYFLLHENFLMERFKVAFPSLMIPASVVLFCNVLV